MGERIASFRARLAAGAPLIGCFVKTPSPIVCEVLARAGLDVLCLDAEHAPFGRREIDGCLAVLCASDQPSLVRVATGTAAEIQDALDGGATGILVPHVTGAAQAASLARAARFGAGGRGYSGSTRAADYGVRDMTGYLDASDAQVTLIVQLEDLRALEAASAIAAVEGVDGIFVGRMDLAAALGKDPLAAEVIDAVAAACAAGRRANVAIGMFTPRHEEIPRWHAAGASLFLLDSDQGFVLAGARRLAAAFREHCGEDR
ncbi:MAG: HpcH/HpaI aldolase family protein [Gammaproteobacteria bacterium]